MKKLVACCAVALAAWTAMAVPTKAEVDAARKVVAELMADDVADQKAGRIKLPQLAEKALELADRAETDAARLLLLQGALISFAQGGDPARAADVLLKIRTDIADVTPEYEADVLSRAVRSIPSRKGGRLYGLLEDARRLLKYRRDIPKLEKTLAAKDDPATRAQLAERFAALGDWKRALAELAKLDDDAGRAARYALRGEGKMTTAVVADIWWRYPGEKDAFGFTVFQRYAAGWYARALDDGSLTGLNRELAQKRIDSVGGLADANRKVSPDNMAIAYGERPQPLVLDLGDGVKMEMVGCPAGKFLMTGFAESGFAEPLIEKGHTVEITRPFWIGKYPVTIKQWEQSMSKVYPLPGVKPRDMDPNLPVQVMNNVLMGGMSRTTIEEFSARLTRTFKTRLPTGYVFRLPTEAEWEYALKADSQELADISYGVSTKRNQIIAESFVVYEDSESYWLPRGCDPKLFNRGLHMAPYIPVGQRKPNAWGICDMGGCALECLLDSVTKTRGKTLEERRCWYESHHQYFVNGVKDPLLFDVDDLSRTRAVYCRYGFATADGKHTPVLPPGRFSTDYRLHGKWNQVIKLRLVVGPDLLKERGLTPPKLDE